MAAYPSREGHDPQFALTLATTFSADRLSLPATADELEQLKETLNTDCLDDAVISDVVIEYPWANLLPMDSITLDDANLLAQFVRQMDEDELRTFGAALEAEEPATFADAACIAENIGDYELVDVTEGAYGREALRRAGATDEVFEMLDGFLDYERLGQARMESDGVRPTSYGMIRCPGSSGHQQDMGQTMY